MKKARYEVEVGVMDSRYYYVVAESREEAFHLGYAEAQADPELSQEWKDRAEVGDIEFFEHIDSELDNSNKDK